MDKELEEVRVRQFDEKGNLRSDWPVSEKFWKDAADKLAAFVQRHLKEHKDCDLRDAYEIAFRLNPEWARVYARQEPKGGL